MNYTEPKVIYTCFPGGKHKVLTMSYDDGRLEDRRLVELFNRYGIRGTFNLNGGLPRPERIPEIEWVELYKGHEVACHTYHHPTISRSPLDQTARQVLADRMQLEGVMGYPVRGLAYPNGSWTPEIAALLPALGIRYARVVGDTHDFAMPHDFMTWKATCHHTHNLLEDGKQTVKGLSRQLFTSGRAELEALPSGHGGVVELDGEKVGAYRDETGELFLVSTRCPHLGCQLEWNPDEKSWECPCHGSRFDHRGRLLEGPAQTHLTE